MVRCWGGKAFYSPMIRFQPFTVPMPLDYEFHKCFSDFFFFSLPPLDGIGQLEWAGFRYYPSLDQLDSDNLF